VYVRWDLSGNPSGLGARSSVVLANSIVVGNGGDSHTDIDLSNYGFPASADISVSHSILGKAYDGFTPDETTAAGTAPSDILEAGAPKVNESGTPTIALIRAEDSPAVDRADPSLAPATDQRGLPRSGEPDIGAYELQPEPEDDGQTSSSSGGGGCAASGLSGLSGLAALALKKKS
jgi:hypothetical protein